MHSFYPMRQMIDVLPRRRMNAIHDNINTVAFDALTQKEKHYKAVKRPLTRTYSRNQRGNTHVCSKKHVQAVLFDLHMHKPSSAKRAL